MQGERKKRQLRRLCSQPDWLHGVELHGPQLEALSKLRESWKASRNCVLAQEASQVWCHYLWSLYLSGLSHENCKIVDQLHVFELTMGCRVLEVQKVL